MQMKGKQQNYHADCSSFLPAFWLLFVSTRKEQDKNLTQVGCILGAEISQIIFFCAIPKISMYGSKYYYQRRPDGIQAPIAG